MSADPLILAFDTSGPHVCAALCRGDVVLSSRHEDMARGQAERLVAMLEEVLSEGGAAWSDLDRIGVGTGPGNFTGIRISVACARGLALGLGIPAIGVNAFEIVREGPEDTLFGTDYANCYAVVPGGRGTTYAQAADGTIEMNLPFMDPPGCAFLSDDWRENIVILADIAARRTPDAPPKPFYIKPADAAPSRDAPPVILDA